MDKSCFVVPLISEKLILSIDLFEIRHDEIYDIDMVNCR